MGACELTPHKTSAIEGEKTRESSMSLRINQLANFPQLQKKEDTLNCQLMKLLYITHAGDTGCETGSSHVMLAIHHGVPAGEDVFK